MTAPLLDGFNTGIQRSWVIIDLVSGLQVPWGGDVLDLESSPITNDITIKPISTQGYDKFKTDRSGWQGSFTVARVNGDADNFEAAQESLYHQGGTQKYFSITETTQNDDGSIDIFEYGSCEMKMTNAGQARKDSSIDLKFSFRGASRQAPQ
jgi:hypothetical protein